MNKENYDKKIQERLGDPAYQMIPTDTAPYFKKIM